MTNEPARRQYIQEVPKPKGPPMSAAERWGRRWSNFADMLMLPADDVKRFGELMRDIFEDFQAGAVEEGPFFDRMREATDLLPMKKKDALSFATKIYKLLQDQAGDHE